MIHLKEYEDFDNLIKDLQDLGVGYTDKEMRMLGFISEFGGNYDTEEFAEYLYDYYHNPKEYDIDEESDYYLAIEDYYYDVEAYKRFSDGSPMTIGNYARWNNNGIENSDVYKLYKEMSKVKTK